MSGLYIIFVPVLSWFMIRISQKFLKLSNRTHGKSSLPSFIFIPVPLLSVIKTGQEIFYPLEVDLGDF